MLEDYVDVVELFEHDKAGPVTRKKPDDDWTLWAIIIGIGGITAILIMGFVLFAVYTLA